ncbi:MAG: hypothetical protein NT154_15315 [Verrucomicrobia bacterium]|nr:hypothetical protein [Verrucomicrobiota bacterium]
MQSLYVKDERSDTGFYNGTYDKALQEATGEVRFATTHGCQAEVFAGMALYPEQKHLEWLRPFTAIGSTALGDQKFGRTIMQALNPAELGRLSCSQASRRGKAHEPTHG